MSGEKRRGDVEGKREEKAEGEGERRHRVDTRSKKRDENCVLAHQCPCRNPKGYTEKLLDMY